jgi:hypothetical protein
MVALVSDNNSSVPMFDSILEMIIPAIKHAECSHKKDDKWDYWRANSGLCWCNKCGMCLNGRWEHAPGFVPYPSRYHSY